MKAYLPLILRWLVPIIWGLGAYFGALYSKRTQDTFAGYFWLAAGSILWSLLILFLTRFHNIFAWRWDSIGLAFGLTYSLGGLIFALAMAMCKTQEEATQTVGLTSLYPLVPVILFFVIQHYPIPTKKAIGLILAVIAGFLLA